MPSLYETTAIVGDVSSSNFTTLYNSSGLSAPNSGGGAISGNLNIAGNLTVQGTSLLQGAVTLGSTLSTPNYTFPLPDGTTDQVLVTDGSGNLYWTNVSAIPGAAYQIEANTTTGGANLTLVDSAGGTDSVKFAGGTNVTVTRTNSNTITISALDEIPNGTDAGEVLVWDGSAWTANNIVTSLAAADRLVSEYKNNTATQGASAIFRRNYAATPYAADFSSSIAFQFDSDTQAIVAQGTIGTLYDAANPSIFAATSLDNFATSTRVFDINSTDVKFDGTNLVLNYNHTGAPTQNATITVERGSSTDATLTWNETADQWQFTNDALVAGDLAVNGGDITTTNATGNLFNANAVVVNVGNGATTEVNLGSTGAGRVQIKSADLDLNGGLLTFRSETTGAPTLNAVIAVERGTSADATLTWNETDDEWVFSDPLFISNTIIPANFERRVLAGNLDPNESANCLTLTHRVTDAANNNTDDGGAALRFVRTSGATGGAEKIYSQIASNYYGTTNTADFRFIWSSDNFTETSPGVYPNSYTLLRMDDTDANFFNNSIYIDYTTAGAGRVGINKNNPAYTLDVNGDAAVSGDIYVSGYQIDLNSPQAGQGIVFDGTKFVNSNQYEFTNPTYRSSFINNVPVAASISGAEVLKRRTGSLLDGQSVAQLFGQIVSTTETYTHRLVSQYSSTGNHQFLVQIDPVGNFGNTSTTITSPLTVDNDNLTLVADTVLLASGVTGAPTQNAVIGVNRGTSDSVAIRWNESTDRWQTTTDGTNFLNIPDQNLDTTDAVNFASVTLDGRSTTDTGTATTITTAQFTLDQTSRNSIKTVINILDNLTGERHCVEVLAMRKDATTALFTTYAEMYTGTAALATFSADVNGGNLRILATPASVNNTLFTFVRTTLT